MRTLIGSFGLCSICHIPRGTVNFDHPGMQYKIRTLVGLFEFVVYAIYQMRTLILSTGYEVSVIDQIFE